MSGKFCQENIREDVFGDFSEKRLMDFWENLIDFANTSEKPKSHSHSNSLELDFCC